MDDQSSFQESSWQETSNAQGDNSWAHVPTPFFVPAPFQDQPFQLNAPTPNGPSVLEFGILQQAIQMQDASPVHVPSLFVTPAHNLQSNASTTIQPRLPGLSTWPQVWLNCIEEPITTTYASIDFLVPVSSQEQVRQLDVPMHLQPPVQELSVGKHIIHVQDPSPAQAPLHSTMPVLSQDQVPGLNAPMFHQPLAWESSIGQQVCWVLSKYLSP
ncbi:hypothetical protein BC826DRAFT_441436 [Russula brevipes]|nr:hypothetical protein BC826DRAFT_441436 [Russula brevipes]